MSYHFRVIAIFGFAPSSAMPQLPLHSRYNSTIPTNPSPAIYSLQKTDEDTRLLHPRAGAPRRRLTPSTLLRGPGQLKQSRRWMPPCPRVAPFTVAGRTTAEPLSPSITRPSPAPRPPASLCEICVKIASAPAPRFQVLTRALLGGGGRNAPLYVS